MIIVRLQGGLGNQLFQYACGRAISIRNDDVLKLDISGYQSQARGDTVRTYSLEHFNIMENIASDAEILKLKYPFGAISKGKRFIQQKLLRQFNVGFYPRILSLKGDMYLDGYWQSENYFTDVAETIRTEITLRQPYGRDAGKMAASIAAKLISVSLHVRRADYVQDMKTNKAHGTCTKEYYDAALACIGKKVPNFHVFVFSDDIEWVKTAMTIPYPTTYVSNPEIADYEELILMSSCTHAIIANSSFSWWGAWLNRNSNKIVIAPRQWVVRGRHNYKDITPPSWIRI